MISAVLAKAIRDEQKALSKEKEVQKEKDFIMENWMFFAEEKGAVKSALFAHPDNGNEVLQTLGLQNVVIKKVKNEDLVKSLLRMEKSVLLNKFFDEVKLYRELTVFFVTGKRALVMSNNQILKVPGRFCHKLESEGNLPDIYYMWAEDLKGKVTFY